MRYLVYCAWAKFSHAAIYPVLCIICFLFFLFFPKPATSQSGKWYVFNTENSGLPENIIYHVTVDDFDRKWICTGEALAMLNGSEWFTIKRKTKKNPPESILRLCETDKSGNIWIGTYGDGMSLINVPFPANKSLLKEVFWNNFSSENSPLTGNTLRSFNKDKNENIWLGSDDGLIRITMINWDQDKNVTGNAGMRWTVFDTSSSGIPGNRILSVASDSRGCIWAGTFGGGLAKYDGMFWTVYNTRNSGLPDNFVLSVMVDKKNNKWIGTHNGGVARFDGDRWTVFEKNNSGLPDNCITMLTGDKDGLIWAGTYDNGMAWFDGTAWQKCYLFDKNIPYSVTSIAIDRYNNKWIGTAGGLVLYNENGIKNLSSPKK